MNYLTQNLPQKIHVIGATGRSGKQVIQALDTHHRQAVALIRNPEKWQRTGFRNETRHLDLHDPVSLSLALQDATHIVSTAHASFIPSILQAGPELAVYIFLGSTRKFTQWPDSHGNGVLAGEQAFLNSNRKGILLHPTMIYGTEGENNVQRLANLLKYLPVIPLPANGKTLIQPIHQSDVTNAILHALTRNFNKAQSLVIAGNSPLSYRDFIKQILQVTNLPDKPIISVPVTLLKSFAFLTRILPFLPTVQTAEIQRLMENKNFDITEMKKELGFTPKAFGEGIQLVKFNKTI